MANKDVNGIKIKIGDTVKRVSQIGYKKMKQGDTSIVVGIKDSGSVILKDYEGAHAGYSLLIMDTKEDNEI